MEHIYDLYRHFVRCYVSSFDVRGYRNSVFSIKTQNQLLTRTGKCDIMKVKLAKLALHTLAIPAYIVALPMVLVFLLDEYLGEDAPKAGFIAMIAFFSEVAYIIVIAWVISTL